MSSLALLVLVILVLLIILVLTILYVFAGVVDHAAEAGGTRDNSAVRPLLRGHLHVGRRKPALQDENPAVHGHLTGNFTALFTITSNTARSGVARFILGF